MLQRSAVAVTSAKNCRRARTAKEPRRTPYHPRGRCPILALCASVGDSMMRLSSQTGSLPGTPIRFLVSFLLVARAGIAGRPSIVGWLVQSRKAQHANMQRNAQRNPQRREAPGQKEQRTSRQRARR